MATGDNVTSSDGTRIGPKTAAERQLEAEQLRRRQEELRRDTAKLADLSAQLKQVLDAANQQVLPTDAVRKAEEIEKLARSVKKRLKDGL